jgi:hypothetical protein
MTKSSLYFIDHVKSECRDYGVVCDLRNTSYVIVSDNIKASGYFDEEVPALVCSMKKSIAIEILAHEFGHFTQWRDQTELWINANKSVGFVDSWLAGEEVDNIATHMARVRDMELDNEKRTVKLIKKFSLPIDIAAYTRKANTYIQFYNYLLTSRKWSSPLNTPYNNHVLVNAMPSKFSMNYQKLAKKYEKLFIEQGL